MLLSSTNLPPLNNGPGGLAPTQRRLRHLKSISARNLVDTSLSLTSQITHPTNNSTPYESLLDSYYSLHTLDIQSALLGFGDTLKLIGNGDTSEEIAGVVKKNGLQTGDSPQGAPIQTQTQTQILSLTTITKESSKTTPSVDSLDNNGSKNNSVNNTSNNSVNNNSNNNSSIISASNHSVDNHNNSNSNNSINNNSNNSNVSIEGVASTVSKTTSPSNGSGSGSDWNGLDTKSTNSSSSSEEDSPLPLPFYTSEVIRSSINPTWRNLDCSSLISNTFSDQISSFNLCVWNSRTNPIQLILQCEVRLWELDFISSDKVHFSFFTLPRNTLIFELRDGFYVVPEVRRAIRPARPGDPRAVIQGVNMAAGNLGLGFGIGTSQDAGKRRVQTCQAYNFVKLISKRKVLQVLQSNTSSQQETIVLRLSQHETYFEMLRQRDVLKHRTSQLREILAQQKAALEKRSLEVAKRKEALIPRAKILLKAETILIDNKQQLAKDLKTLDADRALLSQLQSQLSQRKWHLLSQLRAVYPIQQSQDGRSLSVNGFRLPNSDFTGCDEEQIATALGYVAHILCMASKYLDVPLRYPMVAMCSRSVIRDEISQQTSPKFPLYSRGVDRTRFEYAVFLLNKNLEQLLNSQGLDIITLRHTLSNVQILLSHGHN